MSKSNPMHHDDAGPGLKYDAGKPRLDLVYWPHVEDIAKVLSAGAAKYRPNNWQKVEDGHNRYFAAAMRHLIAYRSGELIDTETGLPHLAHAATNLMFLSYLTTGPVPCAHTNN